MSQGRIWEIVEINAKITRDEQALLDKLKDGKEPHYSLRPRELFQMQEQLDPNQFRFLSQLGKRNSSREEQGPFKRRRTDTEEALEQSASANNSALVVEPTVSTQDHQKMILESNRRLLMQNLEYLLANLQRGVEKPIDTIAKP